MREVCSTKCDRHLLRAWCRLHHAGLCGAIGTFRCNTGQKGPSSSIARHAEAVLMAAMLVTAVATAEEVKSLMGVV